MQRPTPLLLLAVFIASLLGREAEASVQEAVGKVLPSTVCVTRETPERSQEEPWQTSGFIVSAEGLIVTLVGGDPKGSTFQITFADGHTTPAELWVEDRRTGMLLLKADTGNRPAIELSDAEIALGQTAIGVYCTDREDRMVSRGIVTARNRPLGSMPPIFFQTDLATGLGTAGAAVVDEAGRLLGVIAHSSHAPTEPVRTLAVPADYVRSMLDSAQSATEPVRINLGLIGVALGESAEGPGAMLRSVLEETPAAEAGLKEGDVIVSIDDRQVTSPQDLLRIVAQYIAGDEVVAVYHREGEERTIEITLAPSPRSPAYEEQRSARREIWIPQTIDLSERGLLGSGLVLDESNFRLERAEIPPGAMAPRIVPAAREDALQELRKEVQQMNQQVQTLAEQIQQLNERFESSKGR